MGRIFLILNLVCFILSFTQCYPILDTTTWKEVKNFDPQEGLRKRASNRAPAAPTRINATTTTQSINNWIEDVNTVDSFLNVALNLPIGGPLKAGASKALAFAQDEPVNLKILKATPGIDAAGLAAANVLEKVFGDVLDKLGNVVNQPLSLPVAVNAVTDINVNR
jgi:hypothetical protein